MTKKDIALVFDCGATNVRVIAMDVHGQIVASDAKPNETSEDPFFKGGRIWDVDLLWSKLADSAKKVCEQIDTSRIVGVTFTTFGVDGALVNEDGELLYPVISWQCSRSQPIMDHIEKYIPLHHLYRTSGVYPYAFNTINKIIWLKENYPELVRQAYRFIFIPSLLMYRLTGTLKNDATMVGTSMLTDVNERDLSYEILQSLGISVNLFGSVSEAGDKAGEVHDKGAIETGIPLGTPVYFAGHDSQFAIFGSGADLYQPVLSSGTWEVLMVRSIHSESTPEELKNQITTEWDAEIGAVNIGQNWLGSGILEWFSRNFYAGLKGDELYETMISEADNIASEEHALLINPDFYLDGSEKKGGEISGLTIHTKREEIYRALLESLALRLKEGVLALQKAGRFTAHEIICVGGGSKNRLWNQLRADVCQMPIRLIDQKETTVLGAALFVFSGAGLFKTVTDARKAIDYKEKQVLPDISKAQFWQQKYKEYLQYKFK